MTDWSVVGEILASTNLDDVGERIEETMEEASDSLQTAAGSAEAAEEGFESAAGASGTLAASANDAEEEVEELGDELNEVTLESQTASASVAQLSATMQTVEGGGFGALADDLDQASRTMQRGFEEGLDEFVGEPAMSLDPQEVFSTRGTRESFLESMGLEGENLLAGRLALTEALGDEFDDMEHFGDVLNRVTDESVEINDIIGGYSSAFDSAADSAEELSESLPDLDDRNFRETLLSRIQTGEGARGPALGRIGGMLSQGEFDSVGELAQSLSEHSDVAMPPADVLQAVRDATEARQEAIRSMDLPGGDDGSILGQALAERLDPAEGGRAGFGGRLQGLLKQTEFEDAGELIDSLVSRSDVATGRRGVREAVESAIPEAQFEAIEQLADVSGPPALPAPREQETPFRGGTPSDELIQKNLEELVDDITGPREVQPTVLPATPQTGGVPEDVFDQDEDLFPGGFAPDRVPTGPSGAANVNRQIELLAEELDAFDRKKLFDLGEIEKSEISGLDEDRVSITREAAKEIDKLEEGLGFHTRGIGEFREATEEGDFDAGGVTSSFMSEEGREGLDRIAEIDDVSAVDKLNEDIEEVKENLTRSNQKIGQMGKHFEEAESAANNLEETTPIAIGDRDERSNIGGFRGSSIMDDDGAISDAAGFALGAGRDEGLGENEQGLMARHFNKLSGAATMTSTTLGFLSASLATYTGAGENAEEVTEDLDDEFEDLTRTLYTLFPALQNLSANLGPFNISFSNLLVTIPSLIATIGPLIALLAGLAGALIAVTGAFAGLLAVGAIGFVEQLKNNFADIETTGDALKAIFNGLKQSVMEALAPLQGVELLNLGARGIFVTVLRDIVHLIHLFAEASAEILGMTEVQTFFEEMRKAVLGFGDATSGMTMIEGLKNIIKGALPVLQSLLVWFIDVLPEFLAFSGEITNEVAPALGRFANSFIRMGAALTEVGAGAFSLLLPGLALLFDFITLVFRAALKLERALGPLADILFIMSTIIAAGTLAFIKFASILNGVFVTIVSLQEAQSTLNSMLGEGTTLTSLYTEKIKNNNSALLTNIKRLTLLTVRIFGFLIGMYLLLDALGLLETTLTVISEVLVPVADGMFAFTDSVGRAVGVGDTFTTVLQATIGLMIILGSVFPSIIKRFGLYIASLITSRMAHDKLISRQTLQVIKNKVLASSITSVNLAMTRQRKILLATAGAMVALLAIAVVAVVGFEDIANALSDIPFIGPMFEKMASALSNIAGAGNAATASLLLLGAPGGAVSALSGSLKTAIGWVWTKITALGSYTASAISSALATYNLAGAEFFAAVASQGLTTAVWGLVSSLSALQVVSGIIVIGAIALLASEMLGFTNVVSDTQEAVIAAIAAITAAFVGSGWGAIIVALGLAVVAIYKLGQAFGALSAVAIAAITAITIALISSGWGAILVGIGLLLATIILFWDDLKKIVVNNVGKITTALSTILGPIGMIIAAGWYLYKNWDKILSLTEEGIKSLASKFGVLNQLQSLLAMIKNPSATLADWEKELMAGLKTIESGIVGIWNMAAGGIQMFIDNAIQSLIQIVGAFMSLLGKGVNMLMSLIPGTGGDIGAVTSGLGGLLGGGGGGGGGGGLLGGIPMLQKGGFVEQGGLAMLHSNEMVIPASALQNISANAEPGIRQQPATGTGETRGGANVVVNIDNSGPGSIDDRRAREIGNIVRRSMDNRRRREDGR